MKYFKRINKSEFVPVTHYVVYDDDVILAICKTKEQATEISKNKEINKNNFKELIIQK